MKKIALITSSGGHGFMELNFGKLHNQEIVAFSEKDKLFLTFFFILGGAKINQYTSYYTDYEHVGWGEYVPSTKYKTPIEFAKSDSMRNLLKIFGAKSLYLG